MSSRHGVPPGSITVLATNSPHSLKHSAWLGFLFAYQRNGGHDSSTFLYLYGARIDRGVTRTDWFSFHPSVPPVPLFPFGFCCKVKLPTPKRHEPRVPGFPVTLLPYLPPILSMLR
jgi:hypothetical protein